MDNGRITWAKRRYGYSVVPAFMANSLLLWAIFYNISRFGMSSARNFDINFFLIAIFFNIVPLVIIFDVWRYRIGWDEEFIFARPISNFSSYMKMRFDDIEVVDVRARNSLLKRSPADYGSDVIVLYRKEWDGHEIFALDPSITHPYHFKELIKNIYSRRPKAFTDDALDYMQKIGITVTLY